MNCVFAEKVSQLIDGELPPLEWRAVERHLLECPECQQAHADFLSLRSQISDYVAAPVQATPPRLAHLLSPRENSNHISQANRLFGAFGIRQLHPALATVVAVLLLACGVALLLHVRSQRRDSAPGPLVQKQPTVGPIADHSTLPTVSNADPHNSGNVDDQAVAKPDQQLAVSKRPKAPAVELRNQGPTKQSVRQRPPELALRLEDAAEDPNVIDVWRGSADSETLTAQHVEQSELLLRSFRNLRTKSGVAPDDLNYERRRAQQLFYQNVLLRREADSAGDVEVATLLESLEPILLDIAHLRNRAPGSEVRAIKDRVERQNLVALLQVNSTALARANE